MTIIHPLDLLQGYRLGSRQATAELQRTDAPGIHIDFDVLRLVEDIRTRPGQAVILTGTAGDGKTYLAYRISDALGLDREVVHKAQAAGAYEQGSVYIDLDLSAGVLSPTRVERLYHALAAPQELTLICANEGKLDEFLKLLARRGLALPPGVLVVNLSRRALTSPAAWHQVLAGVLSESVWSGWDESASPSYLAWNRAWLSDPGIADRLRRYLLLPYLLGEPITIREVLSFLAYLLGGGLGADAAQRLAPDDLIRYQLFNTAFSEPGEFIHGGRAAPAEKLLWWLFRFDPADQASPDVDLKLLSELEYLDVAPPPELVQRRHHDLIVQPGEKSDTAYRERLRRYVGYARRWYALASESGFRAYFPFRHFESYLTALSAPAEDLQKQIPALIHGLNLVLSAGQIKDNRKLKVFYLAAEGERQGVTIYSADAAVGKAALSLTSDLMIGAGAEIAGDRYLERFPRRLYLQYSPPSGPPIRLPISLLLYEVLQSAASPAAGFPATLWAKERDTVVRFMGRLSQMVRSDGDEVAFHLMLGGGKTLKLSHFILDRELTVE